MDRILEFASNHPVLVPLLIVSFFVAIFSELRRKATGLFNIDANQAVSLINNGAAVIDMRSSEAFGRGHIVNARNIPRDEIDAKIPSLSDLKSKPVIAVCDSGASSFRVVTSLRQQGFDSVYNLKGGMTSWSQEGLPVVTGKKTKSKSGKGKQKKRA